MLDQMAKLALTSFHLVWHIIMNHFAMRDYLLGDVGEVELSFLAAVIATPDPIGSAPGHGSRLFRSSLHISDRRRHDP
jgi:hypothetical protein